MLATELSSTRSGFEIVGRRPDDAAVQHARDFDVGDGVNVAVSFAGSSTRFTDVPTTL